MTGHLLSAITPDRVWLVLGFLGQALFASRFLVQWFRSEMEGRSVVPLAFWYFSIAGGLVSLIYAIHIGSAPFAVGQGSGLLVYLRNLWLIHRERAALARAAKAP
ncbi:MAG TPA: lipid-A-disaccharide synthase N-terminal domain-containing protein [Rhizomicrobium sp.]|nr:lipid-A-disaccharide synthase N-terminal domain-containing protein [Rhizomicrobium sp.]